MLPIDDYETSRLKTRSMRNSRKLDSNLICNANVVVDDMADLMKDRGRGRPVRVRFKPERLIDTYGQALFKGKRSPYGGA